MEEEQDDHYRQFGGIEDEIDTLHPSHEAISISMTSGSGNETLSRAQSLVTSLAQNIIGENSEFIGPYGTRLCVYADWTASGRVLQQIESYLAKEVYPLYGNTHSTASRTGYQSTCYRQESRQIIAQAVNAKITGKAAIDMVLFTGNGTTSAVNKLVHSLGLHLPSLDPSDLTNRPVVFTSSYEHHSNLLPWREAEADVVTIRLSKRTGVCLEHLYECLQLYSDRKLKIGAFSAASNVTGILTDVDSVSILMHKAGGLVFFDYASAAPYVKIDMNPVVLNPSEAEFVYKDAIYFSGHKFIGGPGCPGVLIVKKRLIPSSKDAPTAPGGGTVFYVTENHHRYLSNRVEREESGTPGIIGDIRLGLVFHLKQQIGTSYIHEREMLIAERAHSRLKSHPAIHLLGHSRDSVANPTDAKHLPIISFLIQPSGCSRFLHHNLVSALLNDLFGIQSRGGCMCAGPYSQWLLGISDSIAVGDESHQNSAGDAIEYALLDKHEVIRPGYTRLSLPYFTSDEKIEYILKAIEFIADFGVLFLSQYRYHHKTGEWSHISWFAKFPERKWLSKIDLTTNSASLSPNLSSLLPITEYQAYFELAKEEARKILDQNLKKIHKMKTNGVVGAGETDMSLKAFESIRWFLMSSDFPGSCPIVSASSSSHDEIRSSYQRESIKGAIRPNLFFSDSPQAQSNHFELATINPTRYAQKRNLKFASHQAHHKIAILPRYMDPSSLIGIVAKQSFSDIKEKLIHLDPVQDHVQDQKEFSPPIPTPSDSCLTGLCPPRKKIDTNDSLVESQVGMLGGQALSFVSLSEKNEIDPSKPKTVTPPKKILKLVGQAIGDWSMIEEGDRLLLGLSGGKDSLSLLHILLHIQKKAPINFTIACATVDPQTESFDPSPLIPYVQSLGITYHYLSEPIVEMAKSKLQGDSLCAFCARFKRGLLYSCCRNGGYNKLVLAQHLDDLAESFIMSSLHNGQIRTMKANYTTESDGISVNVIRPLVYVRESYTRDFSLQARLPVINENCPACFEQPKERARVKQLLSQEETMIPSLFNNLRKALIPLMDDGTYVAMKNVCDEVEKRSKKPGPKQGEKRAKRGLEEQNEVTSQSPPETSDEINKTQMKKSKLSKEEEEETEKKNCSDGYCIPCYELA